MALVSALQVLAVMQQTGKSLAELAAGMSKLPAGAAQRAGRAALRPDGACRPSSSCWRGVEAQLGGEGRVVLRASGTEPVIRVMVEGQDEAQARGCAERAGRGRARGRGG